MFRNIYNDAYTVKPSPAHVIIIVLVLLSTIKNIVWWRLLSATNDLNSRTLALNTEQLRHTSVVGSSANILLLVLLLASSGLGAGVVLMNPWTICTEMGMYIKQEWVE